MRGRLLAVFALLAAGPACREAESVVVVNVNAQAGVPEVSAIRVSMSTTKAHDVRIFPAKTAGQPVKFPSSLVLIIPRSRVGRLDLVLEGLDGSGRPVAAGTGQTALATGAQVSTDVDLSSGAPVCGNGSLDPGEECDDANLFSFDGCDFRCHSESAAVDAGRADAPAGPDATAFIDVQVDVRTAPSLDAESVRDLASPDMTGIDSASPDAPPVVLDASPDTAAVSALPTGASCTNDAQCSSTYCVDNVCCENACTGQCMACNLAASKGRCAIVPAGQDPRDSCPQDAQSTCGRDGTCDGAGHCRLWADGTTCITASCAATVASAARTCNGAGTCRPAVTQACAPYACQGAVCATACRTSADCAATAFCDSKVCKPKLGNGTSCGSKDQCSSGFCTDGVCCVVEKCVDTCVPVYPTVCPPYNGFTCAPYGTCRAY